MKMTSLTSLLASISLVSFFLLNAALPVYAADVVADNSDASRSSQHVTDDDSSDSDSDDGAQENPRLKVKMLKKSLKETQNKAAEQDTYFAGKIRTMTSTTSALRQQLRASGDELRQQKALAQQQAARLEELERTVAASSAAPQPAAAAVVDNSEVKAQAAHIQKMETQIAQQNEELQQRANRLQELATQVTEANALHAARIQEMEANLVKKNEVLVPMSQFLLRFSKLREMAQASGVIPEQIRVVLQSAVKVVAENNPAAAGSKPANASAPASPERVVPSSPVRLGTLNGTGTPADVKKPSFFKSLFS